MPSWTKNRYRAAVGALVALLALVVFLNGFGHFNTDIKPEIYLAPTEMIGRSLSAWNSSPYLGAPNFNVGLLPVLAVLSALRGVGLSPEMAFKVFHLGLWLLAAAGTTRLVRAVAPRAGRWGGLLAAVIYLANPYTVQAGATLAIALPLALLPWQLLCLVQGLRQPRSWRWPAAFGLTFFAMSGMNVAVVPLLQLLAIVPVVLAVRAQTHLGWRDITRVVARCALFVVGVSLYWLVPAVAARGTGVQIVQGSETLTGIAQVSSFTEVLRGVGLWPLYGRDDVGPWIPQHAVYVASPFVMVLTMLWPVLGLLALRWCTSLVRAALAGGIALAAVVMVGIFPGEDAPASPFGYLLRSLLQQPALVAFRTTNKIGAVLALSLAVAIGVGLVRVLPRWWRRPGAPPVLLAVGLILIGSWSLPAVGGRLYTSPMDIPDYWKQAARAADEGNPSSSVLLLPGQTRADYRWTVERPDDLTNSLLRRDAVIPETTPNASAPGVNFLAALDDAVQSGQAPATAVSTYARYLGSDKVLLRHDTVWEKEGGARPATTDRLLSNDTGLFGAGNFGRPGQYVLPSDGSGAAGAESSLPPVQLYDVRQPRTAFRAVPTTGQVIVAGDGFAFTSLAEAGVLQRNPMVRYAQDVAAQQLGTTLPQVGRMVITDTNARREVIPNRLTAGQGALLRADQPLEQTRTLGTDPADQTVLLPSTPRATASMSGGTFFDLPYAGADNAIDGDVSTAWRFGDFGRAVGQTITVQLPEPTTLNRIPVSQLPIGSVNIDRVTLTAGGRSVSARLPDTGAAQLDLGGVRASTLTLRVDSLRGDGFNLVGISEIGIPGAKAVRTARTPTTLTDRYAALDSTERAQFARTPLDVLLRRVANTPDPGDDSESELRRLVSLPDARTFRPTATVRVLTPLEPMYDRLAGYDPAVQASSSGYYFDAAGARASQAADGDPGTAWIPGGQLRGSWWQLTGPQRDISQVTIRQAPAARTAAADAQFASRVTISVDGRPVRTATIGLGEQTIRLPQPVRGSTVRVTIDGLSGELGADPPRFTEIETGLRMRRAATAPANGSATCVEVAKVDGKPLLMRPSADRLAGRSGSGTAWEGCDQLPLAAGDHRIEPSDGFTLDSLNLADQRSGTAVGTPPTVRIEQDDSSAKRIRVTRATGPYAVLAGSSIDPRWRATLEDGTDLGAPVLVDGFSAGWIVPDGKPHTIELRFTPQRWSNVALGVSAGVVLVAIALTLMVWPRRPKPRPEGGDDPADRDAAPTPGVVTVRTGSHRAPPDPRPAVQRTRHSCQSWRAWPRPAKEVALVALATFAVGAAGFVASLLAVLLLRRGVRPARLLLAGAVVVGLSMVVYLLGLGDALGEVSAEAVAHSLWPHYLAGGGLVLALVGALRLGSPPRPRTAPVHPPADVSTPRSADA